MTDFCASLSSPYSWLALQEKGLCVLFEGISASCKSPSSFCISLWWQQGALWGSQNQAFYLHGARNLGGRKLAQKYSFSHPLIILSFILPFFCSFICLFIHSIIHLLFVYSFVHSFLHCFIYSLVHLLIHSFCLFV